jgi:hypothetical protein
MSIPNIKDTVRSAVEKAVKDALQEVIGELLGTLATAPAKRTAKPVAPLPGIVRTKAGSKPPRNGSTLRTVFDAINANGPLRTADAGPWLKQLGVPTNTVVKLWKGDYLEEVVLGSGESHE